MGEIVLTVVIILGIIIAGGFLIFFLGDLLMSIVDPKGEAERIKNKRKDAAKKYQEKISRLPAEDVAEIKESNPEVEKLLADIAESDAQQQAEVKPEPKIEAYKVETVEVEADEEKESDEEAEAKRIAEARAALEKRKEEILKRMQAQIEQEPEEQEEAEEEQEAEEETVEVEEETVDENAQIKAELEEARKALAEERARYEALSKQIDEAKKDQPVEVEKPALSKEEYEAQLAELELRLKNNEKELKACKKEYLPLARINKTLARDEKKLNRKEAIVAKQKLVLYGVNNYEDLDEEKAKKLAEDLDLYDGLKLSVQHGKEVMEKNKDRFPVLEKMYYILKNQNEEIRKDIAAVEANLKILEDGSPVVITDEDADNAGEGQENQ